MFRVSGLGFVAPLWESPIETKRCGGFGYWGVGYPAHCQSLVGLKVQGLGFWGLGFRALRLRAVFPLQAFRIHRATGTGARSSRKTPKGFSEHPIPVNDILFRQAIFSFWGANIRRSTGIRSFGCSGLLRSLHDVIIITRDMQSWVWLPFSGNVLSIFTATQKKCTDLTP